MLKLINVGGKTNKQYKKMEWNCRECVYVLFVFLSINLYNLWMVVCGSRNCWVVFYGFKSYWVVVGDYKNYLVVVFCSKNY